MIETMGAFAIGALAGAIAALLADPLDWRSSTLKDLRGLRPAGQRYWDSFTSTWLPGLPNEEYEVRDFHVTTSAASLDVEVGPGSVRSKRGGITHYFDAPTFLRAWGNGVVVYADLRRDEVHEAALGEKLEPWQVPLWRVHVEDGRVSGTVDLRPLERG